MFYLANVLVLFSLQNYPDWSLVSAPVMSTALDDQQFRYEGM